MNNETSKAADVLCPKGHTEPHSDCKHCGIIGDCLDNSKTELIGVILQWHDAYYKEQTRVNKLILDQSAEVERLSKERDAEIAAWQDAIYKVCVKAAVEAGFPDHVIDGAGSDGDELAFTLAEIEQALNCVTEAAESQLSQKCADYERLREALEKLIQWLDDDTLEIMKDTIKMGITFDWRDCEMMRAKIEEAREVLYPPPAAGIPEEADAGVAARKSEESSSGGRK